MSDERVGPAGQAEHAERGTAEPVRRSRALLPLDLVRGFLIGMAELVPGVSGGTVALVTGCYDDLIDSASHVIGAGRQAVTGRFAAVRTELARTDWWLVLPVLVGMAAAVVSVAGVMEAFVSDHPEQARGLFFGLVAVSILVPIRMLPPGARPAWVDAVLVVAVAALTFWVVGLAGGGASAEPPLVVVALAASVAICALVLPGVSGSFFLLTVGLYTTTLEAVDGRDLVYVGVFALGAVAGLAVFVPVLRHLLHAHRRTTLLVMTGLLAGSLRALWPWQGEPAGSTSGEAKGPGELLAPYEPVLGPVLLALLGAAVVAALVIVESVRSRDATR